MKADYIITKDDIFVMQATKFTSRIGNSLDCDKNYLLPVLYKDGKYIFIGPDNENDKEGNKDINVNPGDVIEFIENIEEVDMPIYTNTFYGLALFITETPVDDETLILAVKSYEKYLKKQNEPNSSKIVTFRKRLY